NQAQLSGFKSQVDDLTKQLEELKKQPPPPTPAQLQKDGKTERVQAKPVQMPNVPLPPPAQAQNPRGNMNFPPPPVSKFGSAKEQQKPAETYSGDIEVVSVKREIKKEDGGDKKKAARKVHLPISFMEATLLSGLNAPTSEGAKGQPMPALLRVKTPAVLPNDVKANLKGCFVVMHGYGSLA